MGMEGVKKGVDYWLTSLKIAAVFTGNAWIAAIVVYAANYAQGKLRGSNLKSQSAGQTLNIMSNEAVLPVIYGQAKVGLILVDVQQDPNQPKTLVMVGAPCLASEDGGGIESLGNVHSDECVT